ncbi:hypothetical protein S40288_11241 [Stachybotrys chartarum IBT 40288]|nr:hypothetical protein S40288_11241 [Stachybotrys chartarum IBT 40288]
MGRRGNYETGSEYPAYGSSRLPDSPPSRSRASRSARSPEDMMAGLNLGSGGGGRSSGTRPNTSYGGSARSHTSYGSVSSSSHQSRGPDCRQEANTVLRDGGQSSYQSHARSSRSTTNPRTAIAGSSYQPRNHYGGRSTASRETLSENMYPQTSVYGRQRSVSDVHSSRDHGSRSSSSYDIDIRIRSRGSRSSATPAYSSQSSRPSQPSYDSYGGSDTRSHAFVGGPGIPQRLTQDPYQTSSSASARSSGSRLSHSAYPASLGDNHLDFRDRPRLPAPLRSGSYHPAASSRSSYASRSSRAPAYPRTSTTSGGRRSSSYVPGGYDDDLDTLGPFDSVSHR